MSALEGIVLKGLDLNSAAGNFALEAIDLTPPKKRSEWAQGADSDGAQLVRVPKYDNRTITATVRVQPQSSMNNMLARIGELTDVLQEAEQNPGGIPLEWTPGNSTKTITLYVLTGEIAKIPIVVTGEDAGYFAMTAKVEIVMTAKPFGYGAEVEGAAATANTAGLSTVILTVPTVAGDVPAEGRLVITDTAGVGRRDVRWGLQQRYYDAATALIEAAEVMTPVGGSRSEAANTGAYSPSSAKKTIATTLVNEPTICCNTGVLKHVGSFRVLARVQAVLGAESLAENVKLRLSYQDGEGPLRSNPWQTPNLGGKYVEVDLGEITTTAAIAGAQKWLGQIEAYSENGAAKDVLHINYLTFVPVAEGYGRALAPATTGAGTVSAFDNFTTGVLSGSLNARTPAVGAAWATSGSATDFGVEAGQANRHTKSDSEPRYGVIGSALGNSRVNLSFSGERTLIGEQLVGAVIRWVNAENFAFAAVDFSSGTQKIKLGVKVAGATTILSETSVSIAPGVNIASSLSLTATLDGALAVTGAVEGVAFSLAGSHTSLATGGALASGKGGIHDLNKGAVEGFRRFLSIVVTSLPGVPYVIQPSQSMEVHSDAAIAEDSSGTYYGPVPQYRGSRFFVPQDGTANRTSRLLVKADRNDLEESDQQTIADSFTAQVFLTPRFSAIPR